MLLCTGKLFSQSNTYDYNFSDYFEASDVSLPNTLSLNCSQSSIEFNNYYGRYDFYLNNYNKFPNLTIPMPDLQSLRIAALNTAELVNDIAQDKNFGISIYPNPTNNGFVVNYKNENDKNITIKIIDLTGKLIDSFELSANSEKFYETYKLNNSIYFALFYIDNEMVKQEKVLISK